MKKKEIPCPQCKKLTVYSTDNPFRPFCCERCQLLDLGDWASEKYSVPVENADPLVINESEQDDPNGSIRQS